MDTDAFAPLKGFAIRGSYSARTDDAVVVCFQLPDLFEWDVFGAIDT